MQVTNTYVGRFAPSPTGPLHFGSLVAALASYLDAKHYKGDWLIRIEDLDPPREVASAPAEILKQLSFFGLTWDNEPLHQSTQLDQYATSLEALRTRGLIFSCSCSRRSYGDVYPGTCRDKPCGSPPFAERIRVRDQSIEFDDLVLGRQSFQLEDEIGDFILKRKDGLFAYQLAVVVDDHATGVTHVIRGNDLLDSTPRQIYVAQCLGFTPPAYGHFPVVLGDDGKKLSKQARAEAVALDNPMIVLEQALRALGQPASGASNVPELLQTAAENWSREKIPGTKGVDLRSLLL